MHKSKKDKGNDHFLHIQKNDVKLFGLNAAAILSVIKAGEIWRNETNLRNKKTNDIAEMHGDKRWLPEEVSLGFTNQDFIDRTFGICGRNGVIEAIKVLQRSGVISQHHNTNKKYHGDKSRYFRFHQDIYDELIFQFKYNIENDADNQVGIAQEHNGLLDESISNPEYTQPCENSDRLNLNNAPFKNKQQEEEVQPKINVPCLNLNDDRLNLGSHIMNSNNKYKNIINHSTNACEGENFSEHHSWKVAANDETKPIVEALLAKGMSSKRFYPDSVVVIASLLKQGATLALFYEAYDKAHHATQGRDFGIPYLKKIIEEKINCDKKRIHSTKSPPLEKSSQPVYENDFSKGLDWMGDLLGE